MEEIAVINDLACSLIEKGDYHTAMGVLNRCLACVKKLKECRPPPPSGDREIHKEQHPRSIVERIRAVLNEAKQILLVCSYRANAFRQKSNNSPNLRPEISVSVPPTESTSPTERERIASRSKKRRRNAKQSEQERDTEGEEREQDHDREEVGCPHALDPNVTAVSPFRWMNKRHRSQGDPCHNTIASASTTDDGNEDTNETRGPFVYNKPLRLTAAQWTQIREYLKFSRRLDNVTCSCCACEILRKEHERTRRTLQRNIELTVSFNLIFNIALSHHLLGLSTAPSVSVAPPSSSSSSSSSDNGGANNNNGTDSSVPTTTESARDSDSKHSFAYDTDEEDDDANGYDEEEDDCNDDTECNSHTLQREERLQGALRLYELAFRIHANRSALPTTSSPDPQPAGDGDGGRSSEDDEVRNATRCVLALANNCAHIYELLGQFNRARDFRNRLSRFLMVIIDSGESIREVIDDDRVLDGYLHILERNVFRSEMVLAAAA